MWKLDSYFFSHGSTFYSILKADQTEPLTWTSVKGSQKAFSKIKSNLYFLPALGHPKYLLPFFLFAHERERNALGFLTQRHGSQHGPIGYYSQQLDPVAKSLPRCMRPIVATANLLQHVEEVIKGSPVTPHVPHSVETLLNSQQTQHSSAS